MLFDLVIIIGAAFFAGVLNAIAGGGSFLTFPALVFIGVPPIAANATSAVAVFPGYLSGALGFLSEIQSFDRRELYLLLFLSVLGGIAGAHVCAELPRDDVAAVIIQDRAEIKPSPAKNLEIGEVGLPKLMDRRGFIFEFACSLDHNKGRTGDKVVRF